MLRGTAEYKLNIDNTDTFYLRVSIWSIGGLTTGSLLEISLYWGTVLVSIMDTYTYHSMEQSHTEQYGFTFYALSQAEA